MSRIVEVAKVVLLAVWSIYTSGILLFCYFIGPPPDRGILYAVSAGLLSILMPAMISIFFLYIRWLEKENEKLKKGDDHEIQEKNG